MARSFRIAVHGIRQAVTAKHSLHHIAGALPVVTAKRMAFGDKPRSRVEHLVLRMPGSELRAHRVPGQLEELDAVFGHSLAGALGAKNIGGYGWVPQILDAGRQHDHVAAGEVAEGVNYL